MGGASDSDSAVWMFTPVTVLVCSGSRREREAEAGARDQDEEEGVSDEGAGETQEAARCVTVLQVIYAPPTQQSQPACGGMSYKAGVGFKFINEV